LSYDYYILTSLLHLKTAFGGIAPNIYLQKS